jgi:diphthamide biosynthesis methyltransferase
MKQANRQKRRTAAEIQQLLRHYENGTQSRVEFCAAHRLPVSTFDAYQRRYRQHEHRLIEIDLRRNETAPSPSSAVAVVLASGRRLEFAWAELAQLATHRESLRMLLTLLEQA